MKEITTEELDKLISDCVIYRVMHKRERVSSYKHGDIALKVKKCADYLQSLGITSSHRGFIIVCHIVGTIDPDDFNRYKMTEIYRMIDDMEKRGENLPEIEYPKSLRDMLNKAYERNERPTPSEFLKDLVEKLQYKKEN